jgi:hypothetical protein
MASKCAKVNDLRVGRTLYYVRFDTVMRIMVTKREFMPPGFCMRNATIQIYWMDGRHETHGFAGDMGVSGARYDDRPCMLYTNKGAAERALPRVQAWEQGVKQYNNHFNSDRDWGAYRDWGEHPDPGSMYELVRDIGGSGS